MMNINDFILSFAKAIKADSFFENIKIIKPCLLYTSGEWKKTKAKVRSSVKDMAKELIALYAKRMSTKGFAFSEDSDTVSYTHLPGHG